MKENKQRDLTSADQQHLLKNCEDTIRSGVKQFLAVGQALDTIRSKKLYQLAGFKSFETYCNQKWNITRQHASRLILTFRLNEELSPDGDTVVITSEGLGRRFGKLSPEDRERITESIASGADIGEEISKAEKKTKSDYLKIAGFIVRIETLLSTDQGEDENKIWDLIERTLVERCMKRKQNIVKLQQDAEFDTAA